MFRLLAASWLTRRLAGPSAAPSPIPTSGPLPSPGSACSPRGCSRSGGSPADPQTRGSAASISRRWGSSHGGSLSFWPSSASGSSTVKPGADRRHLEQHAAGLPEVDGLEVLTIPHLGHAQSHVQQLLSQAKLLVRLGDRHRDVVDRAEPVARRPGPGAVEHADPPSRLVAIHRQP